VGGGGGGGLVEELISFFTRGERRYLRFDRALGSQPTLDADRIIEMAAFAGSLDEPAEARRWAMRLVREHPDDPRTLVLYADVVNEFHLHPGAADSIPPRLALLDTLFDANGGRDESHGAVWSLVSAYGDDAAKDRWARRTLTSSSVLRFPMRLDSWWLRDHALRALTSNRLATDMRRSCEVPAGKYPVWRRSMEPSSCRMARRDAFNSMSEIALMDGNLSVALAYADSALKTWESFYPCWNGWSHRRRGEALLALHDTTAAAAELALDYGIPGRSRHLADSVGRVLRPAVDSARWVALTAQVASGARECVARWARVRAAQDSASR
jgi:hypothetical protein